MSENSPHSSEPRAFGLNGGSRRDLREVAQYQKCILVCILINLIAILGQFVLPPDLRIIIWVGMLAVSLSGALFVFILALKIYNTAAGVIFAIWAIVPCIGLIALVIVNERATSILKDNGVRVGLLGANLSEL